MRPSPRGSQVRAAIAELCDVVISAEADCFGASARSWTGAGGWSQAPQRPSVVGDDTFGLGELRWIGQQPGQVGRDNRVMRQLWAPGELPVRGSGR